MMPEKLVYVALAPALVQELELRTFLEPLESLVRIEYWQGTSSPTVAAVSEAVQRAQVLLSGWGTPELTMLRDWSPERSPLRMVMHTAGTVKYLVPVEALERGLLVSHANDALADAVAEFTLGAIILGRRQAFATFDRYRHHRPPLDLAVQHEIHGSTIGIIGASAIGRRVLRLLAPLGANLLLADPYVSPEAAAALGATHVSLPELLQRSDIVSLHAPVTNETIGMLGAAEFAAMRDGALFINTARGRLIDADALLAELKTGRISALLDVTDPVEPLPSNSPFFKLENCVVLPHVAAVTVQARQRQGQISADEVRRFLTGESLAHQVDRARWEIMA